MDRVQHLRHCALALALVLGVVSSAIRAQEALRHPGRVVEIGTNRPLEVAVKAWPDSRESGREADCPLFGKSPVDSAYSKMPNGRFELRISTKNPTYTTTYCAAGYYPRADRDIPNRVDGAAVVPMPVRVYPRKTDPALYASVVTNATLALVNDLAYLESIDPREFERIVTAVGSERRREVLRVLVETVRRWRQ